ncbi:MAG: glycosyltransferase [Gammaproteobacteria bacterium]|nr:glycosyltransferase [Gammaproteobacteria bacterium]NND55144.1 glycosyltransferase [Gammaproteobacteria bacterium]
MTVEPTIGIVIIGRNEGERLTACLDSIRDAAARTVYVDSGSTDDSISNASQAGADVVELPMDQPFTAGRARNAGFERLCELHPDINYVQFIDGDCRVAEGWLDFAARYLQQNTDVVVVCGRRKEIHPKDSVYNDLCDFEWNTPVGESDACGGDFMVVAAAFSAVNGFSAALIAGEEPELCFRLRQAGGKIYRADQLMTWHDAAMHSIVQWARRTQRAGYAYAARSAMHRHVAGGLARRENLRIVVWAAVLPFMIVVAGSLHPGGWLLALLYPMQLLRLRQQIQKTDPEAPAGKFAALLLLGKWPEFYGQLTFLSRWLRGAEQTLIEYK